MTTVIDVASEFRDLKTKILELQKLVDKLGRSFDGKPVPELLRKDTGKAGNFLDFVGTQQNELHMELMNLQLHIEHVSDRISGRGDNPVPQSAGEASVDQAATKAMAEALSPRYTGASYA